MYKILKLTHEEWLEERKKGIGSSEVGVIMGLCHYSDSTPLKLWRRKIGLDAPLPESPAMLRGHIFEPAVVEYFKLRTGAIVDPESVGDFLAVDTQKPYLRVSPDRICWPKDTPKELQTYDNAFILECKTTKKRIYKKYDGSYDYPDSWYAQVQYQMGVMGIKKAAICWLVLGEDEDVHVWVDFNPAFYKQMLAALDRFWNINIIGKIPPPEIVTEDDAKLRWPNAVRGKQAVANEALCEMILNRNRVQQIYSEAEKRKSEYDKQIRTVIGDNEVVVDSDGNILLTYRNGEPKSDFSKEDFRRDHPDLYNKYCRQVSIRTLRFKASKGEKSQN